MTPKKMYYNYDEKSFEYISKEEAGLDKGGNYLQPANSTEKEPLSRLNGLKEGCVNIFDPFNNKWVQTYDYRGDVYGCLEGVQYKVKTKNRIISEIPYGYTSQKPNKYDMWDEEIQSWVYNKEFKLKEELMLLKTDFDVQEHSGIKLLGITPELDGVKMDGSYEDIAKLKNGYDLNKVIGNKNMKIRTFNNKTIRVSIEEVSKILRFLAINATKRLEVKWSMEDAIKHMI